MLSTLGRIGGSAARKRIEAAIADADAKQRADTEADAKQRADAAAEEKQRAEEESRRRSAEEATRVRGFSEDRHGSILSDGRCGR